MDVDVTIGSPTLPDRNFHLWRGHDAQQRMLAYLGKGGRACCRAPHHTASLTSLLGRVTRSSDGAGLKLQPGEILLAGAGVLVLTDLPEFRRDDVEHLASAWRNGALTLRTPGEAPAFLLVPVQCAVFATAQPCPCGMLGRPNAPECACTTSMRDRWEARIDAALARFRGKELLG